MVTKLKINSVEALRAVIFESIEILKLLSEKDGWVIAGCRGDSLYAFVGHGCGYMGACLAPYAMSAVIFSSETEATLLAEKMDYRNEHLKRIHLRAWSANSYFTLIIENLEKTIEAIDSL